MNRTSRNIFALTIFVLGFAIVPAQAAKPTCPGHPSCGTGDEQTFSIEVTVGGQPVMSGPAVEGGAETVEVTDFRPGVDLGNVKNGDDLLGPTHLGQIITVAFNEWCLPPPDGEGNGGNNELVPLVITSADNGAKVEVHANPEQGGDWTVVVAFLVGQEDYTLLLLGQGEVGVERAIPGIGESVIAELDSWSLRGGGKGRKKRCQPGTLDLLEDLQLTVTNDTTP